ncbi:MAG: transposase, partial [Rhodopila sp.]
MSAFAACSGGRSASCAASPSARCTGCSRWTRLGLWRRLLERLRRCWRLACGDAPEPSAAVIDSRSCRSAPSCFDRGIDGGKKIRGVKIHVAVDKYGMPLALDVSPANRHDT